MVKQAQRRVDEYNVLQSELYDEMMKLSDSLERVKGKIRVNVLSEQNQNGLLMSDEQDYLKCLDMNHRGFEELLRKDEVKWSENHDTKMLDAANIGAKIQELMEQQQA